MSSWRCILATESILASSAAGPILQTLSGSMEAFRCYSEWRFYRHCRFHSSSSSLADGGAGGVNSPKAWFLTSVVDRPGAHNQVVLTTCEPFETPLLIIFETSSTIRYDKKRQKQNSDCGVGL